MTIIPKQINQGLITNNDEYWAMHFCSVLETFYYHKTLEYSFNHTAFDNTMKSLCNFKGLFETGFLFKLRNNLENWGLQYLLCYYLKSDIGKEILTLLIDEVIQSNGYYFSYDQSSVEIFVTGEDSNKCRCIDKITRENTLVFGFEDQKIEHLWNSINHTDLCIIISPIGLDNINKLAIIGEVEGHSKTKNMLGNSFWVKQPTACRFGIGIKWEEDGISIQRFKTIDNGIKVIVQIGTKAYIIHDFHESITVIQILFYYGYNSKFTVPKGSEYIVSLIKDYWTKPVLDLIGMLTNMITKTDSPIILFDQQLFSSVPAIIIQ